MSELQTKFHEYLQALSQNGMFNGSVFVVYNGQKFSNGYGFSNFEHSVLNTPETKFRLGSITKEFTATAIFILIEQGKLKLQNYISQYLESSPDTWKHVTVQHLLNHTSGIPEHTNSLDWKTLAREVFTPQKIISLFDDKPLDFQPGEAFRYSNSGYILLGKIIENVSQLSYERFIESNVFNVLGMNNSGYDFSAKVLGHRANGYELHNGTIINADYLDMGLPFAAGGLYSTVEDLFLWDQALSSEVLLPQKIWENMFLPTPFLKNYGYGFWIENRFGHKVIGHMGGVNGFAAAHHHYFQKGLGIVVLSNFPQTPLPHMIAHNLAAIAFGENVVIPPQKTFINLDHTIYQLYEGEYILSSQITLTILSDGQGLLIQATGGVATRFFSESEFKFSQKFGNREIEFYKNAQGEINQLILKQDSLEIIGHKK